MGDKKKLVVTWLGIFISAFFLFFFVRDLLARWEETKAALIQANYLWLIPAGLSIIASLYLRAFRWRVFLGAPHRGIRITRLFNTLTLGFFGNLVLPARAGEFIRPYMLARAEPVRFSEAFATVVVERVFDLIAVVAAFAWVLAISPFPPEAMEEWAAEFARLRTLGWVMGAGTVVFTVFLCLVVRAPQASEALFKRLTGWLPRHWQEKLLHLLGSFIQGLSTFSSLSAALKALAWTAATWFSILLSEYFTIVAFGFDVSLFGTTILMSLLAFAVMVPQAPGYLGPFQMASSLTLVACFAVDKGGANAYAIVLWFIQLIPILIAGLICLNLEGLTLGQLWRSVKAHEEEAE